MECRSLGGHLHGRPVSVRLKAVLDADNLILTGQYGSMEAPNRRVLSCAPLDAGVTCNGDFGPTAVKVISNGNHLIETVTDRNTGNEVSKIEYLCDAALRIR